MVESWEIAGRTLEFIEETHTYIYDGVILPSITQILKTKFGKKYNGISKEILNKASQRGTEIHKAIEDYETKGSETQHKELRNYKFLKKQFKFECLQNEIPVVLFKDDKPIAAGRIDLVLKEGNNVGIGDIKRTSTFDKKYVAYQTNLYRLGYQQSYGTKISFLRGVHLRNDVRKYIELPINENIAMELINKYLEKENNNE